MKTNKLQFEIIPTYNCKLISLVDISIYSTDVEGATLQVQLPDREKVIELNYKPNGVTVLNSNSLQYTKVDNFDDLIDLPDGWYTLKISVCPYEMFWYEKDYYRICKLQCKYNQALLKLDLNKCENCYASDYVNKLNEAEFYMRGIIANTENNDIKGASSLYKKANSILDNLLYCKNCSKPKTHGFGHIKTNSWK